MLDNLIDDLRQLVNQQKNVLVVFDLDSTLFDVSPRLERILLDFASSPLNQKKFPDQIPLLLKVKTQRQDWGIVNALHRAGLEDAPIDFQEAIKNYWKKSFFSNHYLQFDDVYEGALEFVQTLDQIGAHIAYLTGRDIERMGEGTIEILHQWNFPLHDRSRLVLKPHRSLDDAQFKTDWFIDQAQYNYARTIFFENEPVNLQHLLQYCPKVEMVFFESTHAGKAEPPTHVPRIMNFLLKGTP
jgi:hypothetical protein